MIDTIIFRGPEANGPGAVVIMTIEKGVLPPDGDLREIPEGHTYYDLPHNEIIVAESGGGETFMPRATYHANISVWEMDREDLVEIVNQMVQRYHKSLEARTLVFGFPDINPATLF